MEVEWLILADSAQVVGNKLYLLGGGWDVLTVNSGFPLDQRCALAMAVKVPWNETNRKKTFEIEVMGEDPATEQPKAILKVGGQFEIGRPPGIPPGQDQRVQIAMETNVRIEYPGTKLIVARIEGEEMKRTFFNVVAGPLLRSGPPKQAG